MQKELKAKLKTMITDCQKTTHASEADLSALRERRMPSSHEGQCLIECIFSTTKIMKDGKIDKSGAMEVINVLMFLENRIQIGVMASFSWENI